MFLYISDKHLTRLENIMSQYLDDNRAILERIAQGGTADPQMKADIADLKTALSDNTASDSEVKTLLTEVLNKLAAAPPAPPVP